ncbi:MAG: hypothetical protein UZ12_BCD005000607 [Bacteroidetes bacterium OLB12]|nr:MAG: hypothetical protein UZ12_BCD005000607 [Bacteroidetes bacterium OLB12]
MKLGLQKPLEHTQAKIKDKGLAVLFYRVCPPEFRGFGSHGGRSIKIEFF